MSRESALDLVHRLHPELTQIHVELVVSLLEQSHIKVGVPLDTPLEEYARALAKVAGAFPYDGPVGNGLTTAYYQERFREMAMEQILVLKELTTDA